MEYLNIQRIRQNIMCPENGIVEKTVARYYYQLGLYSTAIQKLIKESRSILDKTETMLTSGSRTNPLNPVSRLSAPYFANEDVIGGVIVEESVQKVNTVYEKYNLPTVEGKIKLGPGIGYVQAPKLYDELLTTGITSAELAVNYNAPNGEKITRLGLRLFLNAKTDLDPPYEEFDTFLTSGATEAIDATVVAFNNVNPGRSIVILGPSYYAALYSSQLRKIPIKQIIGTGTIPLFPTIDEIKKQLPQDAGLIILTSPNNPTGEMYSEQVLKEIMKLAKEESILVLYDAIFERLRFSSGKNPVQIAQETEALDNLVVVDSLSKTLNLPGMRPGVLATRNKKLRDALSDYLIAEKCNPPLIYGPIFLFEGLARQIEREEGFNPQVNLSDLYNSFIKNIDYQLIETVFTKEWFLKAYTEWQDWNETSMKFYKQNLDCALSFLRKIGLLKEQSPDQGAFNTLVKLTVPTNETNSLDFLFKMMVGTGTYTQNGPCFGLDQSAWDKMFGLWTRITYACDRQSLFEGLIRLSVLSQTFEEKDLGNPSKYPTLQISY